MQVRHVKAVVVETNPSLGVMMEIPMETGSPLTAYMLVDSEACQWSGEERILSPKEFVSRLHEGSVIQISGTMELRGRQGPCSPEEYSKSANRFWIQPYSARLCPE